MSRSSSSSLTPWRQLIQKASDKSRAVRGSNYVQIATVSTTGEPENRTVVFRGWHKGSNPDWMEMITDARSVKTRSTGTCEMCWWLPRNSEQFRLFGALEFVGPSHTSEELLQARARMWQKMTPQARVQFFWPQPRVPYVGDETYAEVAAAHGPKSAPSDDRNNPRDERQLPQVVGDSAAGDVACTSQSGEASLAESPDAGSSERLVSVGAGECENNGAEKPHKKAKGKGGKGKGQERPEDIPPIPDVFLLMLLKPQRVKYLRLTDNFSQESVLDPDSGEWREQRVNP